MRLAARLFVGLIVAILDLYIISGWMWVTEHNAYFSVSPLPAFLITVIALLITVWYLRWLLRAAVPPLTREDCPHFNIEGDQKCNLLPEPSECKEYCRTLSVFRRDDGD